MTGTRCPICDEPMPGNWAEYPDYPFCTKRCRLVDLGRWLSEEYTVAADKRDQSSAGQDDRA